MEGIVDESPVAPQLMRALHEVQSPGPPHVAAGRAVADGMRVLTAQLMATSAPPEVLEAVAERIVEAQALLESHADPSTRGRGGRRRSDPGHVSFEHSPLQGWGNPVAPPLRISMHEDRVVGRVRFGDAYEGPPGCVHGGHIAAVFDEVLGVAQTLSGRGGMTGTLSVRYRRPTPLGAELRVEARLVDVKGRKVTTAASMFAGSQLTAEATGVFVTFGPDQMKAALERRRDA